MHRINRFIKSYKNILGIGLAALLLVIFFAVVNNIVIYKYDVVTTNSVQLEKISEQAKTLSDNASSVISNVSDRADKNYSTVSTLIKYEQGDVYNDAFLLKCIDCLQCSDNIIVCNSKRQIVNSLGTIKNIDYSKSYYDALFNTSESEATIVKDEDDPTRVSVAIRSGNYYILSQRMLDIAEYDITGEHLWQVAYLSVGLDIGSYFVAVNKEDNTVVYSNDNDLIGKKYDGDTDKYLVQSYDHEDRTVLYAITPKEKFWQRCFSNIWMFIAIFTTVLFFLISYIVCLREDELDPSEEYSKWGKYFLRTQTKRFKSFSIVVIIFAVVLLHLGISLHEINYRAKYLEEQGENCRQSIDVYSDYLDQLNEANYDEVFCRARLADAFLNNHSSYLNKAGLRKIADALNVKEISLFAADGSTISTSSSLDHLNILEDPNSSLYELKYALIGKEGVVVQGDSTKMSKDDCIYAVPRRDSEGVADGIITVTIKNGSTSTIVNNKNLVESSKYNKGYKIFFADENGVVLNGNNNSKFKIAKSILKDGYTGRTKIGGLEYIVTVIDIGESGYLCLAIPIDMGDLFIFLRSLLAIILLGLYAGWICYDGLGTKYRFEQRYNKLKDADDWERKELNWDELSIGKKMGRLVSIYLYFVAAIIVVLKILQNRGLLNGSSLAIVLSGDWTKSINAYSIIANIFTIILFYAGIKFVGFIISKSENIIGDDAATVSRLLCNLVKYIGVVICSFIVVTNFGVDATTALASLGIAGFAITFGAQELVKDMISGMFILFEGKFKVGDMIDINGDWYWIQSIGVRTTTVEAWGQVRVINNSNMTGLVNLQNASSVVNIDVMIDNKYNIDTIKELIMAELPAMKEQFPPTVATPSWKGIQEYSASGTVIRMRTYCQPLSQGWVGRAMRQEIKRILDENGIILANEAYVVKTEANIRKEI